jgi:aryl-alcohol dehydrogenase-like predicted oxidoreductase
MDASKSGRFSIGANSGEMSGSIAAQEGSSTVHRLGFGAMRITGEGVWGQPKDRDEAIHVLKRAVELGVNFIDTADAYGPYVSEELIVEALHPYPADLLIATKVGLTRSGPGVWESDASPAHIRESIEGSLKRLKVDQIELYQLHRIDPKVPVEDTIRTLVELQKEGKFKHFGLSEVSVEEIKKVQEMIPVATVQNLYNLSERKHEDVLKYCERNGIGFIPWFPLNTGKLATDERLAEIAASHNASPSQIALAWLLKKSPVMLPIPGTSSVKHLEENIAAADIMLSDEDYAKLEGLSA